LPRHEHVSLAELLLRKAEADVAAGRTLAADGDQHDEAIGFHAQQAVEKAVKAVLALAQIEAPRTHDLTFLVELLGEHGIEAPEVLIESEWLTPWAVTTRYDDLEETLDRAAALELARAAIDWAAGRVSSGQQQP